MSIEKSTMNSYVPDNTHYNHAQRLSSSFSFKSRIFNGQNVRIRLDRSNTKVNDSETEKKLFKNGHANGSNHHTGGTTPDRVYIIKKYRMKD